MTIKKMLLIAASLFAMQLRPCAQPGSQSGLRQAERMLDHLHTIVVWGFDDQLKALIDAHAAIDLRIFNNWTMLHVAAQMGQWNIARMLINAHFDIDAQDDYHNTPLHIAMTFDQPDFAKYLIQAGADTTVINYTGETALDIAHAHNNQPIIEYFMNLSTLIFSIYAAVKCHDIDAVKSLIDRKAPIGTIDIHGQSPMHYAVGAYDHTSPTQLDNIARIFIKTVGYPATAIRNLHGQTPLHIAAMQTNLWIAEYLLREGFADVNARDDNGNTALHLATSRAMRDKLLRHGADVSLANNTGATPMSNVDLWQSIFYS